MQGGVSKESVKRQVKQLHSEFSAVETGNCRLYRLLQPNPSRQSSVKKYLFRLLTKDKYVEEVY